MEGIKNHVFNKKVRSIYSGNNNVINKSSKYRDFQEIFQQTVFSGRHLCQVAGGRRIHKNQSVEKIFFIAAGHNGKGAGKTACDHICFFSDHISDKVADYLYIDEICIGHSRLFRASASQKVNSVYRMFRGKLFFDSVPFIAAGSGKHIMDKENRTSASFFCIKNFSKTPFIIVTSVGIKHFLQRCRCGNDLVCNVDDGCCGGEQHYKCG